MRNWKKLKNICYFTPLTCLLFEPTILLSSCKQDKIEESIEIDGETKTTFFNSATYNFKWLNPTPPDLYKFSKIDLVFADGKNPWQIAIQNEPIVYKNAFFLTFGFGQHQLLPPTQKTFKFDIIFYWSESLKQKQKTIQNIEMTFLPIIAYEGKNTFESKLRENTEPDKTSQYITTTTTDEFVCVDPLILRDIVNLNILLTFDDKSSFNILSYSIQYQISESLFRLNINLFHNNLFSTDINMKIVMSHNHQRCFSSDGFCVDIEHNSNDLMGKYEV